MYADNIGKVANMLEESLNEVVQSMHEVIGTDLYGDGAYDDGDDGALPCDGLVNINDTDNTYLGVLRTTAANAYWKSNTRAVTNNFLDDDNADGVCNGLDAMRLAYLDACKGQTGDRVFQEIANAERQTRRNYWDAGRVQ